MSHYDFRLNVIKNLTKDYYKSTVKSNDIFNFNE